MNFKLYHYRSQMKLVLGRFWGYAKKALCIST
jgi:hypothetical protein